MQKQSRMSFILKVKKENFIKAENNVGKEQGVEDTEKK